MTIAPVAIRWMRCCLMAVAAAVAATVLIPVPAGAAEGTVVQADTRYTGNIAAAKVAAANVRDEYARLEGDARGGGEHQEGFFNDDLSQARKVYDALAADYERAASAWMDGDDTTAQKIMRQIQTDQSAKDLWRVRIAEYRRAQANAAPDEQWAAQAAAATPTGALSTFHKLLAAKKTASAAWGDVAEAAIPGADPKQIDTLKNKAQAAGAEVEIATWQWSWDNQLYGAWTDKSITPQDIQAPLAALKKAEAEAAALRREQVEHERRVQQAFADISQAQQEVARAIGAAREAHTRAAATQAAATEAPIAAKTPAATEAPLPASTQAAQTSSQQGQQP